MYPIVQKLFPFLDNNFCETDWKITGEIGTDGTYGEVWSVCCRQDCRYVAKYMPYDDGVRQNKLQDIIKEIDTHQLCATKGLCPYIYDAWLSSNGGVMVMKMYDMTVRQLLLQFRDLNVRNDILANVITLLDKLHSYGIYHGDLHLDNIMVSYTPSHLSVGITKEYNDMDYKYYFIDFGKGGTFSSMNSSRRHDDYIEIASHLQDMIDEYPDHNFEKLYSTMKIYLKKFDILF
jgi:serine/threonine protein kinase